MNRTALASAKTCSFDGFNVASGETDPVENGRTRQISVDQSMTLVTSKRGDAI